MDGAKQMTRVRVEAIMPDSIRKNKIKMNDHHTSAVIMTRRKVSQT